MAIGSLDYAAFDISGFSNYADPDIMTLCTEGEAIKVAYPHYLLPPDATGNIQTEKMVSGTSYATPLTSRIAASFWQRNLNLTPANVKSHFINYLNKLNIPATLKTSNQITGLPYRALTVQQVPGLICSQPELKQL